MKTAFAIPILARTAAVLFTAISLGCSNAPKGDNDLSRHAGNSVSRLRAEIARAFPCGALRQDVEMTAKRLGLRPSRVWITNDKFSINGEDGSVIVVEGHRGEHRNQFAVWLSDPDPNRPLDRELCFEFDGDDRLHRMLVQDILPSFSVLLFETECDGGAASEQLGRVHSDVMQAIRHDRQDFLSECSSLCPPCPLCDLCGPASSRSAFLPVAK